MITMNISEWYKKIVDSGTETPPESVWNGVQDQLDVDAVWTRIDTSLSSQVRKKRIAAFAVAATLFLTVSTLGLWYILSPDIDRQLALQLEPVAAESYIDTLPEAIREKEVVTDETESFTVPVAVDKVHTDQEVLAVVQKELAEAIFVEEIHPEGFIASTQGMPPLLANLAVNEGYYKSLSYTSSVVRHDDEIDHYKGDVSAAGSIFSTAYVGITGQFANTWMLNNKTISGLKSDELTFTDPSFGRNFGLQIGAGFTQRLWVRAEMMWLNPSRQTYREYINGNFVTNDIILDYYSFKLLVRYNAGSYARPHYLLAGTYTGFMKQATQTINGVSRYVDNDYENLDYGVILGYEYPFPLTGHLTFTPGLFAQMGLNNVFSGSERIPAFLNRTHNASLNISFAISYSF